MPIPERWSPKLLLSLRHYSARDFTHDVIAGITVGLVALPLAMAFGISSGVSPQAGLYTAVVAGFIISALGGSKTQIGGPTGAFVVIVAGIIAKFGAGGLALVTLMAGGLLILMGATGLGSAIRFIPRPVTIGFTNGIALLIASTQIKDAFGLVTPAVPSDFIPRMKLLAAYAGTVTWQAVVLTGVTLAIILLLPKYTRRIPGSIVALLLCTVAAAALKLPVETIGSRFGGIPSGLPHFSLPAINLEHLLPLFPSALTVALLAAIESLLSAVVSDSMSGDRHNPNVELIAQGIANMVSPLFGGIPATGAIARTATNVRSGATSPVSGIIHALTLLTILLVAAPAARFIPLATLAGVLFVVAWNMGEWRHIKGILRLERADISVWAITFFLTVVADLTIAVEVGLTLAALLYVYRIAETTSVTPVTTEDMQEIREHAIHNKDLPSYLTILRIHGPFLFGTTDKLVDATHHVDTFPPIVVLRLRHMTAIDATGLHAIEVLADRLRESGRTLVLCGARPQPRQAFDRGEFAEHIGQENIQPNIEGALTRAREIYDGLEVPAS
jgi:SulP family sulfate permease